MNTIVIDANTVSLSIDHLLQQAQGGGIKLQDANGKLLAFLVSPADQEALTYVEASLDLNRNAVEIAEAVQRQGGITTAELLERAEKASEAADK